MNTKQIISTLLFTFFCTTHPQESSLRPRVQLAQTKTDLDGLLSLLNVSTASQGQQAIKQLQNQVTTLEQKNAALVQDLEKQGSHQKVLKESTKKCAQAQTQVEKLKKQLAGHKERLKRLLDKFDTE